MEHGVMRMERITTDLKKLLEFGKFQILSRHISICHETSYVSLERREILHYLPRTHSDLRSE